MVFKSGDDEKASVYSVGMEEEYDCEVEEKLRQKRILPRFSTGFTLLNLTVLCITAILFSLSILQNRPRPISELEAIKTTSSYSPLLDQIDLSLSTTVINGTLLNTHPPSIYRLDPSPEVDAAWSRIANVRTTSITKSDVVALGKDPSISAKYPPDFGLGSDAYIAEIDVFHQIHCLDSLRKEIWFDHYYKDKFPDGKVTELHRAHTSHCIYILLQNLMCSASVDVITHRWLDVQKHPFPDFNINKKCRDFDAVLKWQEDHVVPDGPYHKLRRPADMEPVHTSKEFVDIFRQWNYRNNDDRHPD